MATKLRRTAVQTPTILPTSAVMPAPSPTPSGGVGMDTNFQVPAYTDAQLLSVIPAHTCALIGDSGTGKSTMAASYPKTAERPQLVLMFDPPSKAYPYKEGLEVVPLQDEYYQSLGMVAEACLDAEGQEVRRIEYFVDPDPNEPRAAKNVETRLTGFEAEAANWSSVVFDSMSFYQYGSLRRAKYLFPMPAGKEQGSNLAWYNQVKEDVNRLVRSQAVWWSMVGCSAIFIFHTNEEKAEFASEVVRGMAAVGKLPSELPSALSEMYRLYVQRAGDVYHYRAQTKHDGLWAATSIIAKAPSPVASDFRAVWAEFVVKHPPKG